MININGKTFNVTGNNISVINDKVYIDGDLIEGDYNDKDLKIIIEGDISLVKSDRSVEVRGNVKGNVDAKGSVNCKSVDGSVNAGGSVNCDDIGGSVSAGGSVNCDDIGGNVVAGGSVRRS